MLFWRPPLINTSASHITVSGTGLSSVLVGQSNSFTIVAPRHHSFRPSSCSVAIEGPAKPEIKLKASGNQADCSWKPLAPGMYRIYIRYSDQDIPGSPFLVNVRNHLPALQRHPSTPIVRCFGPGLVEGKVGRENKVYIEGANRLIGGLNVLMKGPSKPEMSFCKTDDESKVGLIYKTMVPGRYLLIITLTGIHVNGSPFPIEVS